jgi:hypothetical protein
LKLDEGSDMRIVPEKVRIFLLQEKINLCIRVCSPQDPHKGRGEKDISHGTESDDEEFFHARMGIVEIFGGKTKKRNSGVSNY